MTESSTSLEFSDGAIAKVAQLIAEDGNTELKLRIAVTGGGCFVHARARARPRAG